MPFGTRIFGGASSRLTDVSAEKMVQLIEHNMKGARKRFDIPAEDLADIGNAAVAGLMQFAALDEFSVERFGRLVESLFVLLTAPYSNVEATRRGPGR